MGVDRCLNLARVVQSPDGRGFSPGRDSPVVEAVRNPREVGRGEVDVDMAIVVILCTIGFAIKNFVARHLQEKAAVEEAMAARLPH